MPAIKFYHSHVFKVAALQPQPFPVEVRLKYGNYVLASWMGMVCEAALERMGGLGYAKIKAREVTDGDGILCNWRPLKNGQHILGWRVEHFENSSVLTGVYGIVGKDWWPIVVGEHGIVGSPKLVINH